MKFSIRDLFLVTVIVALALGWWVDRARLAKKVRDQSERIDTLRADLAEEQQMNQVKGHGSQPTMILPNSPLPTPNPPQP